MKIEKEITVLVTSSYEKLHQSLIDNGFIIKDKYLVNDVITYHAKDNTYVTHRIVDINQDTIITKGDANNTSDEPINEKDIIGKIVMKFSILGFILYLFSQPLSWVILLIIGFVITLLIPKKDE